MVDPLRPGSRVGGYVVEAEIGRGGMGTVYRARQETLGRAVALKLISPALARDETFRRRFRREWRLAAAIEDPHVVTVYEAGADGENLFIAMRLIEGTDLRALLRAEQWLEPARAATLADQVGGALDAAHARGLVHRDVKPANVLIGSERGREWAYLTDFGLSKPAEGESELTGSGQWMGTLDYASPEQIRGEPVDARSDVYSLGCVLFEALSGRIPFERPDEVAKLYAHVNDPPPSVAELAPDAPAEMEDVVRRALAKDPAERFPSGGDLGRAALAATRGERVTVPERSVAIGEAAAGVTKRMPRFGARRGRRRVAAVAAIAALVLAAALAWLSLSGEGDGGPKVAGRTELGGTPVGVSVGGGLAWVTDEGGGEIARIDDESGEEEGAPIETGGRPTGIQTAGERVWVTDSAGDLLLRLRTDTGAIGGRIEIAGRPSSVRVGEGSVWVTSVDSGRVTRLNPRGKLQRRIRVGSAPAGIAVGEGSVWVANSGDGTLTRIAPGKGVVVGPPIRVGVRPRGVATGEGAVWVANALDDTVTRVSPAGRVEATIEVGERPAQVAVGEGSVWITNEGDGTVTRIDPGTGEAADTISVGGSPRGIAVGNGLVWVADSAGGAVTRIEP